jgi:hypothetical protein
MYTVIKPFKDINDGSFHNVGEVFNSEDAVRVSSLVSRGLIEGAKKAPSFDSDSEVKGGEADVRKNQARTKNKK